MYVDTKPSFAFLVLAFNHQDYILEHLESIKYLVQTHGTAWDVDLIVNDDASRDQTRTLVDRWLAVNATMFRHVKTLYNPKNLGTCASVNNVLSHMVADRCKLTAGDDVYSFENIFELTRHEDDVAMVSGRALYLLGDDLALDQTANQLATATEVIYQYDSMLHRFKHWSYNNAPNLLYASQCLLHPSVRGYLQRFDVVEDWPIQVAIARTFPEHRFKLIDNVLVYYRRTLGSTFIIANKRFLLDKNKIYDDLISEESSIFEKVRLQGRKFCFNLKNPYLSKIINMDAYCFLISVLLRWRKVKKWNEKINLKVALHIEHYQEIKTRTNAFASTSK
jgi:glycosyltransferase involved in cell wall biosynthesis